ncbi:MAG: aldehyde dehydrogenase family protein [Myxococcota bacterium]
MALTAGTRGGLGLGNLHWRVAQRLTVAQGLAFAPGMQRQRMRVGAELRDSGEIDVVVNPYDGSPVREVAVASAGDIDDAIERAVAAFEHTRRLPAHRRAALAQGVAARIGERAEALAQGITAESGKPITLSRAEVARAQTTFSLAAAACYDVGGQVHPVDLSAAAEGRLCLHVRVPRGPVAAIAPFNFPLNLIAHKLAPALAVGASTVLKPPPQCPLTGLSLAEILVEAGAPDGAISALHCSPDTAQRMVEDPRMRVLSFTGSDRVGWRLKALAGPKQVLLELGGNAPCVLDRGVDVEAIMPRLLTGAWGHAGQVCIKVQRVLVHRSYHDAFLDAFVRHTEALAVGDPTDPATVVGPMIDVDAADRVVRWVDEATRAGAVVHCGGRRERSVVWPTVLTGVPADAKVLTDEVFGPVTVVQPYEDFGEALRSCNAGRYGLQAGVFTRDIGRALHAFETLDYGGVMINDVPTFRVDNFPYGGVKDSGFGREGVRFAMEEMSEPKVLVMRGLP